MRTTVNHQRKRAARGFSMLEMMLAMSMFVFIMVLIFGGFKIFMRAWRTTDARNEIHRQFIKVNYSFDREVTLTALSTIRYGNEEGKDWILFSSPLDANGTPHYDNKGAPDWQKTVIFYTIRPAGDACQKPADSDMYCPHKYIIRKDVDYSLRIDENEVTKYLTLTLDTVQAATEHGVLYAKAVAENVIFMKAITDPQKVSLHVGMLRLSEAERQFKVGLVSLDTDIPKPYIHELAWATVPKNSE
ncbi:MAG: hypothetical protein RDV48_25955 [Candidatus Eremiobacteraeota bacterium]|nr:hypothetical protein [Candidatus Eremiobacteraeota bacterium]